MPARLHSRKPTRGWVNEMDTTIREHFVYRIFDATGALLYIGRTKNPKARWYQHRVSGAEWVARAARCRMIGPLPYREAHALEGELILSEQPPFNVQGRAGTWWRRSA